MADDESGCLGIRCCQAVLRGRRIHIRTRTRPFVRRRSIACIDGATDHISSTILSFPLPSPQSAVSAVLPPPRAALPRTIHYGLAQHLQQRPKHHPQLPERRQFAAAFQCPSKLANVRAMGRLRSSCPACQRISRRWRQGERLESTKHWRYVQLLACHLLARIQQQLAVR